MSWKFRYLHEFVKGAGEGFNRRILNFEEVVLNVGKTLGMFDGRLGRDGLWVVMLIAVLVGEAVTVVNASVEVEETKT